MNKKKYQYRLRTSLGQLCDENPLWLDIYENLYYQMQGRKQLTMTPIQHFNEANRGYLSVINGCPLDIRPLVQTIGVEVEFYNMDEVYILCMIYAALALLPEDQKDDLVYRTMSDIGRVFMMRVGKIENYIYHSNVGDYIKCNPHRFPRYEKKALPPDFYDVAQPPQSSTTLSKNQILFRSHEEQAEWAEVFRRFLTERKQINQDLSKSPGSYINRAMACFYHHLAKKGLLREGHPMKAVSYFLFTSCGIQGIGAKTHGNVVGKLLTQCYDMERGGEMDLAIEMLVDENS
jgi:hypothetical protein